MCDNTVIVSKLQRSEAFLFLILEMSTEHSGIKLTTRHIPLIFFSLSNEDFIMKQQDYY